MSHRVQVFHILLLVTFESILYGSLVIPECGKCNLPQNVTDNLPFNCSSFHDEMKNNCPTYCCCYISLGGYIAGVQLVVSCDGQGDNITEVPNKVPEMNQSVPIYLSLRNTSVVKTNVTGYLDRVTYVNFRESKLRIITDAFLFSLRPTSGLDLRDTHITKLPDILLQKFNPCRILYDRSKEALKNCSCANRKWYETERANCKNFKTCSHKDSNCTLGQSQSSDSLYLIFGLISASSVGIITIYYYRFKIKIWKRKWECGPYKLGNLIMKYDVYVSADDKDDEMIGWIKGSLLPELERKEYKVYYPPRNSLPGELRAMEILENVSVSRNYILILNRTYCQGTMTWKNIEWKHFWNMYLSHKERNIIIINFDFLSENELDCTCESLRAYLDSGEVIDFANFQNDIMNRILNALSLGSLFYPRWIPTISND